MAPASFQSGHGPSDGVTVCVMDAAGRLGSSLVEKLLQTGYNVHAAVQNHGDMQIFNGVACVDKKRLKMFHSDPLDYHSIIDALKGCSGLFYAFEPPTDQSSYDEFMAEVEVRAAHNVLEACAQTNSIDKVVFTSSVTSVIWREDNKSTLSDMNERHWTDINFCRKFKLWHALSKTLAEKTAWALAMDRGVNMVSVNAGLVMDSETSITDPYLKGAAEMYEDGMLVTVDLSFLVDAHICIFKDISTYGRYLCFNNVVNRSQDAIELTKMLTPVASPLFQSCEEDARIIQQKISDKKLKKLMVDFKRDSL